MGDTARGERQLPSGPGDLRLIPRVRMKKRTDSTKLSLNLHRSAVACVGTHIMHKHNNTTNF